MPRRSEEDEVLTLEQQEAVNRETEREEQRIGRRLSILEELTVAWRTLRELEKRK